jgi:hypothetical protein
VGLGLGNLGKNSDFVNPTVNLLLHELLFARHGAQDRPKVPRSRTEDNSGVSKDLLRCRFSPFFHNENTLLGLHVIAIEWSSCQQRVV